MKHDVMCIFYRHLFNPLLGGWVHCPHGFTHRWHHTRMKTNTWKDKSMFMQSGCSIIESLLLLLLLHICALQVFDKWFMYVCTTKIIFLNEVQSIKVQTISIVFSWIVNVLRTLTNTDYMQPLISILAMCVLFGKCIYH